MNKMQLMAFACLIVGLCLVGIQAKPTELSGSLMKAWKDFQVQYNKVYENKDEENKRLGIFATNLDNIYQQNLDYEDGKQSWGAAVNEFADLTDEEFKARYLTLDASKMEEQFENFEADLESNEKLGAPAIYDWLNVTNKIYVNPIQNQGSCGSCWAFSTVALLESAYALKYGKSIKFSEKQFVDCDSSNSGCNGGWPTNALNYAKTNGILLSSQYSYTATQNTCPSTAIKSPGTYKNLNFFYNTTIPSDNDLKERVYSKGVLGVAIDASNWRFYSTGVINDTSACGQVNHAVNIVGYDSGYWIVRNSWGTSWGLKGYFKVKIGSANNACRMKQYIWYAQYI